MSMKCFLVPTERQRPTISIPRKTLTFIASFPAGFVMKRGSTKEPVGKKNSGLGKLMSVLHQVKILIMIIIITIIILITIIMGKLISVLHQNAASLVTTRAAHNGPDQVKPSIPKSDFVKRLNRPYMVIYQVLPATDWTTCRRNQAVKIRRDTTGLGERCC